MLCLAFWNLPWIRSQFYQSPCAEKLASQKMSLVRVTSNSWILTSWLLSPNPATGPPILIGHFFSRFWARRRFNWTSVRPSAVVRPFGARAAGRSGERASEPAALIGPKRHSAFNEMSDAKLELGSEEQAREGRLHISRPYRSGP